MSQEENPKLNTPEEEKPEQSVPEEEKPEQDAPEKEPENQDVSEQKDAPEQQETSEEKESEEQKAENQEASEEEKPEKKQSGKKRPKTQKEKKKILLLLIEGMLVAIFVILLILLRYGYNTRNVEHYYVPEEQPVAEADGGVLRFDYVKVRVPEEGVTYAIGYDKASDDEEYPSVPSSVSAYYKDENGNALYEVMLYRDRVMPKATDHETYSLDDWFSEWASDTEEGAIQESYQTPHTAGFLIRGEKNSSFTYYFAVETESNIEQYVLELDYYDEKTADQAEALFNSISESLAVKKLSV